MCEQAARPAFYRNTGYFSTSVNSRNEIPPPCRVVREIAELKVYSEYFPIKYLFSNEGVCLGLDTKKCSYLFLASKRGMMFRRRPVGDKVVENLNYDIISIEDAIRNGGA